jgi:peptidoglycan/xylan/chitin deacetylase (PgdA/CDA1 family)
VRAAVPLAVVVLAAGCGGSVHPHASPPPVRHEVHARQPRGAPQDDPVPILEYHVLGSPPPGAPYPQLYVSTPAFVAQLGWLARHGWRAVTLDAVLAHWADDAPLPRRPVVLTFDDGYATDWRTALPDLRAHGWPGNLNLQVGNLVPRHVRQLIAGGWEVDAHTFTHPDLTLVGAAQLAHEVAGSRAWIRRMFHAPVEAFAYPGGREDAAVRAEVRRAGFRAGETEVAGWASPRDGLLTLDRLEIERSTSLGAFERELDRSWG